MHEPEPALRHPTLQFSAIHCNAALVSGHFGPRRPAWPLGDPIASMSPLVSSMRKNSQGDRRHDNWQRSEQLLLM